TTKTFCPVNTLTSSLHQILIYNTHLLQPRSSLKDMVVRVAVVFLHLGCRSYLLNA
ncbi:hypothetical protein M405DRAFT_814645, partial [Rhizopogon salebrosus TDB-379]